MPKLDDLELKIKQTTDSVDGITKMSNALKRLATNANGLGGIGDSIKKMSDALRHFPNDSAKSVKDFATAMVKLKNTSQYASAIGSSIRQVTRALNDMINAIDVDKLTAIADAMNKVQDASKFARVMTAVKTATKSASGSTSLGDTETSAKAVSGAISETGEAASEATIQVSAFSNAMSGVGGSFADAITSSNAFTSTLKQAASATINFGKKMMALPFKPLASAIGGIGGKVMSLFNAFKRIAMYRALRTAIKAITSGFSEGIKHLYQWSEQTGNSFKQSMDSLATSAHYLRDSLGAMASPLLDALAPAVEVLVEKFVTLLNVVNQFIATFTGKDTWRKAVRTPTTYGDAMKQAADNTRKATKAQKELNKALQGFDELNLITTSEIAARKPTTSAGTADGGISATEFVEVDVDDWIKDIKEKIDQGDWTGLGVYIAGKFNDALDEFDPDEWGGKIADKINNAFDFLDGLINGNEEGDGIHWGKIGIKAAKFTDALFKNVNWETVKNVVVGLVDGGLDLVKGFFDTASWDEYALDATKVINGLFNNVTAKKVGDGIASIINAGFKFLKTAVLGGERILQNYDTGETITIWENGLDFQGIGEAIGTAIEEALTGINWTNVGKTLAGIASGLTVIITKAIGKIKVKDIFDALGDLLSGFFDDPAAVVNSLELVGIIAGFKLLFGTAIPAALGGLGSAVAAGFSTLFGSPEVTGAIASGVSGGVESGLAGAGLASSFGSAMVTFMGTWGLPILGAVGITAGMIALAKKWSEENDADFEAQSSTPDYQKSIRGLLMDYIVSGKKVQNGDESYLYEMNALQSTIAADTRNKIVLPLTDSVDDVAKAISEAQKWLGEYDTPSGTQTTELDTMYSGQIEQLGKVKDAADKASESVQNVVPSSGSVETFKTRTNTMSSKLSGTTGSLMAAANTAHDKGIAHIAPDSDDTKAFADALRPWKKKLSGTGKNDGSLVQAGDAVKKKLDAVANGTYNPKITVTTTGIPDAQKSINDLAKDRTSKIKYTVSFVETSVNKSGKTIETKLSLKDIQAVKGRASGGWLDFTGFNQGTVYVAGEVPGQTEIVGQINGKTGVASGKEITGIADAVYNTGDTEANLLREQNRLLRQILAKNMSVTLAPSAAAGKWVSQSQAAYAKASG